MICIYMLYCVCVCVCVIPELKFGAYVGVQMIIKLLLVLKIKLPKYGTQKIGHGLLQKHKCIVESSLLST